MKQTFEVLPLCPSCQSLQAEVERLRKAHGATLAEIRSVGAEREAVWAAIEHGYDIEPRAYFEKEAPRNGFIYPLAQAFHHIWKREPKVQAAEAALTQLREGMEKVATEMEAWPRYDYGHGDTDQVHRWATAIRALLTDQREQ